jgi:hypothetical protein
LFRILLHFRRIALDISRHQMVGDNIFEEIKPEQRNLRQHPAFVRDAGGQHIIESRDSVSGYEQKLVAAQAIHIAHFAAGEQF